MKVYETIFNYNNKEYKVIIAKKSIRSVNYRFLNNEFHISCPYFYSIENVKRSLEQIGPRLIKRVEKRQGKEPPFSKEYVYIFGEKYDRSDLPNDDSQLMRVLARLLLEEVTKQTRIYEQLMNIKIPYKVTVRQMKSRWGSNSYQTHHITYSLNLVYYSKEIINSVVVHELAHYRHRDHQQGFYDEVLEYCPSYHIYNKKLKTGTYK